MLTDDYMTTVQRCLNGVACDLPVSPTLVGDIRSHLGARARRRRKVLAAATACLAGIGVSVAASDPFAEPAKRTTETLTLGKVAAAAPAGVIVEPAEGESFGAEGTVRFRLQADAAPPIGASPADRVELSGVQALVYVDKTAGLVRIDATVAGGENEQHLVLSARGLARDVVVDMARGILTQFRAS
jgi:hypothetical protein